MASEALGLEPSVAGCIAFSALGGALEVMSTMVLAYPEHRAKQGRPFSKCFMRGAVVVNLLMMLVASVAYIVGSWYGPVSLSVPVVMASKLLFNLVIVGTVLKMENFSKDQRVGTYVIALSIFSLPEVGPQPVASQDVLALLRLPLSIAWSITLGATMAITILAMIVLVVSRRRKGSDAKPRPKLMLLVLVTAQVTSAVIGTSVGKVFAVAEGSIVGVCLGITVLTAVVNVGSLMMAAASCNQGIFVPLQTCATLGVNMVTGLMIWEDQKTITQWVAYFCLYGLMGLGIYLMANADVLEMYKRKHAAIAQRMISMELPSSTEALSVRRASDAPRGGAGTNTADGPDADKSHGSIWISMLRAHDLVGKGKAEDASKFKSIAMAAMASKSQVHVDRNVSTGSTSAAYHIKPEAVQVHVE